jgi:hypothetical protein
VGEVAIVAKYLRIGRRVQNQAIMAIYGIFDLPIFKTIG